MKTLVIIFTLLVTPPSEAQWLTNTANHLSKLFLLPTGTIPKTDSLTDTEKLQLKLLKCVDKIVTENKGGQLAPSIAQKILLDAMENNALSTNTSNNGPLVTAMVACNNAISSQRSYSDRQLKKHFFVKAAVYSNLFAETPTEQKVKALLIAIATPTILYCDLGEFSGEIGYAAGVALGLSRMKCLYSDGKVKTFFGATTGLVIGGGVSVRVHSTQIQGGVKNFGPIMVHTHNEGVLAPGPSIGDIVTVLGSVDADSGQTLNGFAAGLEWSGGATEAGFGIPFINGKRRWKVLLDQLNAATPEPTPIASPDPNL